MAWTKAEAESYMKGESVNFDEGLSQPESNETSNTVEETTSTAEDNSTSENSSEVTTDDKDVVSSDNTANPEKIESEVENKEGKSKKKYTDIERQRHAFKQEKDRRKEVQNKLADKLKEIEELKAKLAKYEGLKKEHFNDDEEAYTDYKIDQRFGKEKAERLQREYDAEQMALAQEEAAQTAEYRLQTNFPDEIERNKYQQLIVNAETNFSNMHPEIGYGKFSEFLMSETDKTILKYLQDSDNSPKLIRHFIMKPEVALRIMNMRGEYNKVVELKQLENRMLQHERIMASKNKVVQPIKKNLPNTGKVVTTNNMNSQTNFDKAWSKADAEAYMRNHR